jgi:hypothetical protein
MNLQKQSLSQEPDKPSSSLRAPMKSSKSNTKIRNTTKIFFEASILQRVSHIS